MIKHKREGALQQKSKKSPKNVALIKANIALNRDK